MKKQMFMLCFISVIKSDAQKIKLKGTLIDQNRQTIEDGELSIQEPGLPNFIFSLPDAQVLKEKKSRSYLHG